MHRCGPARSYFAEGTWAGEIRSRSEARRAIVSWAATLDAVAWKGQAGGTDRAVAEALARLALARGGPVFVCIQQQVAVDAGVHERTARNALRRLQAAGWIEQVEAPTATTATRWRLRTPAAASAGLPGPVAWLVAQVDARRGSGCRRGHLPGHEPGPRSAAACPPKATGGLAYRRQLVQRLLDGRGVARDRVRIPLARRHPTPRH